MCHDNVKFQYWLSSEFRINQTGKRNKAEFRLDFSNLPPGRIWEVKLAQYALQCDDGEAVDEDGENAPIGIVDIQGFSLPYNMEVTEPLGSGNAGLSTKLSRIDLGPYSTGDDECCINPASGVPALTVNRPQTGTYIVELMSGTTGALVTGKDGATDLQPWMALLEFTLKKEG